MQEYERSIPPRVATLGKVQRLLVRTSPLLVLVPVFMPALMDLPYIGRSAAMILGTTFVFVPPVLAARLLWQALRQRFRPEEMGGDSTELEFAHKLTSALLAIVVFTCLAIVAGPVAVWWRIHSIDNARRALVIADVAADGRSLVQVMRRAAGDGRATYPPSLAQFVSGCPDALPLLVPHPEQQQEVRSATATSSVSAARFAALSQFAYAGAGVPATYDDRPRYVLLISRSLPDSSSRNVRIVVWSNGESGVVEEAELEAVLKRDAEERRRNGIPPPQESTETGAGRATTAPGK